MKNQVADIQEAADEMKSHAKLTGAAAADMGRAAYRLVQNKAVTAARQTDRAVRSSPYVAVGLSFGVGLILGAFLSRPKAKAREEAEDQE
jgi:ElaB/YqjD/DUF883 family membrane-anchored ribosome-binding protein